MAGGAGERRSVDWQAAQARLERARRALESGGAPTPEESSKILEERARALARPLEAPAPVDWIELLVFAVGQERYGVESGSVVEVLRERALTPVPGTPAALVGIVAHRGQLLAIADLNGLGGPTARKSDAARIVVVEEGDVSLGLLADEVEGLTQVAAEALAPPPGRVEGGRSCLRAVTPAGVGLLDVASLVQDPRLLVDDEVV